MAMNETPSGLEYSRLIYHSALEWYKNADAKAQIILTIDGAFLAFLTSSVFMKHGDLATILSHFGGETWLLLCLMSASLTGSILSAILCLRSRVFSAKALEGILASAEVDVMRSETYKPELMFFFQFISRLNGKELAKKLSAMDKEFEVHALAHQTPELSKNVMRKHVWVNRGFALAGLSLILFLGVAISYVLRVGG